MAGLTHQPPIMKIESSRELKNQVEAGNTHAQREEYITRHAAHSGADVGVWRACSSDKRGGVDEHEEHAKHVHFTQETTSSEPTHQPVMRVRVPTPEVPTCKGSWNPWGCILVVLIILIVGGLVGACASRPALR